MYIGRSIGRQIEWLRDIIGCHMADHVQFHVDGSVRMGDMIVARTVDWDDYDHPIFDFTDGHHRVHQVTQFHEMCRREYDLIGFRLRDEDVEKLKTLSEDPLIGARNVHRQAQIEPYTQLRDLGLVAVESTLSGWDEGGKPLHNLDIRVSRQGWGLLHEKLNYDPDSPQIE